MTDTVISLINKTQPIPINYVQSQHGFSDSNNKNYQYLFELIINGESIGKKYFRNLEDNKYSHLIKLNHRIKLSDIKNYKVSVSIYPSETASTYELGGDINQNESYSTQRDDNLYIEFTKNDNGFTMCSCFYVGLDHDKLFASPPN